MSLIVANPLARGSEVRRWQQWFNAEDLFAMPFSEQNRMTTLLLIAVLLTTAMGMFAVIMIARVGTSGSTPLVYAVLAFVAISLKILLAMLQTEFARRQIISQVAVTTSAVEQVRNDTAQVREAMTEVTHKVNGGLAEAIRANGEEVRKAERDQLSEGTAFPSTMQELETVLDNFAGKLCERMAVDAAKRAAELVLQEVRDAKTEQQPKVQT